MFHRSKLPRNLRRYETRLVLVERNDGEIFRGHLASVFDDHVVLRAAEWLQQDGSRAEPRTIDGEYVILTSRIVGMQFPPTS